MVTFPNAKINIGLFITEKRKDGFHNLESVFYPIPIKDALEIIPNEVVELEQYGLPIAGEKENNLIWRAYELLKKEFPTKLFPVKIILQKSIPMGAGMGGGSSDGSFMLRLLNDYFDLKLTKSFLKALALQLGSDCPFFIDNVPAFAHSRGEALLPINIDLSDYSLQTITPQIHISTADAFAHIVPQKAAFDLSAIHQIDIKDWKDYARNDFEKTIFPKFPVLQNIKESLYNSGALFASLSGTGSTVYGIFPKKKKAQLALVVPFSEFYIE